MRSLLKASLTALALITVAGSANAAVPHKGTKYAALKDDRCEVPNRKLDRVRGCNETFANRRVARKVVTVKRPPPPTFFPNVAENNPPERNKNEYVDMGESGRGGRDGGNGSNGGEANGPR